MLSKTQPHKLPRWAERLKNAYLAGEASQFLLHSNVFDYVNLNEKYVVLREFLYEGLLSVKDVVIFYNRSQGILFAEKEMEKKFRKVVNLKREFSAEDLLPESLPKDPDKVLPILDEYLSIPNQRTAIIIDYAETVIPDTQLSFMMSSDRDHLVTLHRWAHSPRLLQSDNVVILITENLADIHKRIRNSHELYKIQINMPTEEERLDFIRYLGKKMPEVKFKISAQILAQITAGLSRLHLEDIFNFAKLSEEPITFESIRKTKKEIIEHECFGLLEISEPKHGFEAVGGMEPIKKDLQKIAEAVKAGVKKRVPMGIMFVGPMGTGKTFVAEAFAKESGLTAVKLKNFRDKWVGSTEGNLEKILNIIKAMGFVIVIVDEVDRALGSGENEGDSGTSSRVFARLKAFMSDTSNRGKIIWLMMTNRPDKLDVDLKRPGRFDKKIPFFFPQSDEERELIFQALLRKNKLGNRIKDFSEATKLTEGYSGADLEAILFLADEFAEEGNRKNISEGDLLDAIKDFIPSRYADMIRYMELLAVFECSSRRMLPGKYKSISNEELTEELRKLSVMIN